MLAHIDVVEAKREEWTSDPFKLREVIIDILHEVRIDDKAMAAAFVSVISQLRKEGYTPNRDIILVLTADEELGQSEANGAQWLINNQQQKVDAEFGISEGGEGN